MRILYIEDNDTAREYVQRGLGSYGIEVDARATGEEGLELCESRSYAMIVLDVELPGIDGLTVLEHLRSRGDETPVLILSVRAHAPDRTRGLNLGADDYLGKPFSLEELVARIRAIRRRVRDEEPARLSVADLVLDTERHSVTRAGAPVALTPKEFSLLEQLMRNEGRVLSRAMITERVWGAEFEVSSHVINVHINHLRRKVDSVAERPLIHTVTGVGYMLEDREESAADARDAG